MEARAGATVGMRSTKPADALSASMGDPQCDLGATDLILGGAKQTTWPVPDRRRPHRRSESDRCTTTSPARDALIISGIVNEFAG